MKKPAISIIVPVGKGRVGELDGLKASLKSQTFRDFELIIEEGPNAGENRTRGVKKAKGEIILFMDSDIRLSKGMLELVKKTLEPKSVLVFWKATAFVAFYKKDFIPFDKSFRYAEDTKWFYDIEKSGIKVCELIQNDGNPTIATALRKSFNYPFEWKDIPSMNMQSAFLSAGFDILKRLTTMAGIIASFFARK